MKDDLDEFFVVGGLYQVTAAVCRSFKSPVDVQSDITIPTGSLFMVCDITTGTGFHDSKNRFNIQVIWMDSVIWLCWWKGDGTLGHQGNKGKNFNVAANFDKYFLRVK